MLNLLVLVAVGLDYLLRENFSEFCSSRFMLILVPDYILVTSKILVNGLIWETTGPLPYFIISAG